METQNQPCFKLLDWPCLDVYGPGGMTGLVRFLLTLLGRNPGKRYTTCVWNNVPTRYLFSSCAQLFYHACPHMQGQIKAGPGKNIISQVVLSSFADHRALYHSSPEELYFVIFKLSTHSTVRPDQELNTIPFKKSPRTIRAWI